MVTKLNSRIMFILVEIQVYIKSSQVDEGTKIWIVDGPSLDNCMFEIDDVRRFVNKSWLQHKTASHSSQD